jgi:hypothetical protein
LIVWSVDDYFTFDDDQHRYLDAGVDSFLYWHRTSELPQYAKTLRRFAAETRDGLTLEELITLEGELTVWGERVAIQALPIATEILFSTTPSQRAELELSMPRESEKYVRWWLKRSMDERRARWRREVNGALEDYVGELSADQRALVTRASESYVPDEELWLGYRKSWQCEIVRLLSEQTSYGEFALRFRALVFDRSRWYGEAYKDAFEGNQQLYRNLAVALVSSLSVEQHTHLEDKLVGLAIDLEELAADVGPPPPPLGCLVSCSAAAALIERNPRDDVTQEHELRQAQRRDHRGDPHPERGEVEILGDSRADAA